MLSWLLNVNASAFGTQLDRSKPQFVFQVPVNGCKIEARRTVHNLTQATDSPLEEPLAEKCGNKHATKVPVGLHRRWWHRRGLTLSMWAAQHQLRPTVTSRVSLRAGLAAQGVRVTLLVSSNPPGATHCSNSPAPRSRSDQPSSAPVLLGTRQDSSPDSRALQN